MHPRLNLFSIRAGCDTCSPLDGSFLFCSLSFTENTIDGLARSSDGASALSGRFLRTQAVTERILATGNCQMPPSASSVLATGLTCVYHTRPCLPSKLLSAFLYPLLPLGSCPPLPSRSPSPSACLSFTCSFVLVCFVELSVAALLLFYA